MRSTGMIAATLLACAACGGGEHFNDAATPIDAAIDAMVGIDAETNRPPTALAGADRVAIVDRQIRLSGYGEDPDADTVTYSWTQTGGPPVAISDPTVPEPVFRVRRVGEYEFTLVVSDGRLDSEPDTVAIDVWDLNGGAEITVELRPDGTLWSWGRNDVNQLGDGGTTPRNTPGRVCDTGASDCAADPFTGAVAIAVGASHTLALRSDGTVWAWGSDAAGALGNGAAGDAATPSPVCADAAAVDCAAQQLSGVIAIAAGYDHSVALKADGTVWTWGYNFDGELGNGVEGDSVQLPAPVCAVGATAPCTAANGNILDDVVLISAGGGGHSAAVTSTGALVMWGNNKSGQIGVGTSGVADAALRAIEVPTPVCASDATFPCATHFTGVVDVDVWSGHTLAQDSNGRLWGWGGNDEGELSMVTTEVCRSATTCTSVPRPVCPNIDDPCTLFLDNPVQFVAGRRFSAAVRPTGLAYTWGDDSFGQHGFGPGAPSIPTPVCAVGQTPPCGAFLSDVAVIATGNFHMFAITNSGQLVGWGSGASGELGNGANDEINPVPVAVTPH